MKSVFDSHCHYHLFDLSIEEEANILKEEFEYTHTEKCCFLSIPQHIDHNGNVEFDPIHNIRGIFFKEYFSPNSYTFAGLVHPKEHNNIKELQDDFLKQVKKYFDMGFDGMKMIEGYPTFIKYTGLGIDSPVFDKFYDFCEKNSFPIIMHIANPNENWDINKASKEAIKQGRVYDSSFPTKEEITNQLFKLLNKHPNLTLIVAHFGFFSEHYEDAVKYMSYPNTYLDTTPGGEQFINMSKNWSLWLPFFDKYQDRIIYGTDFYPFKKDENWLVSFNRRPKFLREFFETDTIHIYLGEEFKGAKLDENILEKIYMKNAEKLLGNPRTINKKKVLEEITKTDKSKLSIREKEDLDYIEQCNLEN